MSTGCQKDRETDQMTDRMTEKQNDKIAGQLKSCFLFCYNYGQRVSLPIATVVVIIPSQQSKSAIAFGFHNLQLSVPQTRSPVHCESRSQSPSPSLHWTLSVQQRASPFPGSHLAEIVT